MKHKRKQKHTEHENHERWLVSYADFITLLFAFFVVLYATATQNQEKQKKFESALRSELRMMGSRGGLGSAAECRFRRGRHRSYSAH